MITPPKQYRDRMLAVAWRAGRLARDGNHAALNPYLPAAGGVAPLFPLRLRAWDAGWRSGGCT